MSANRLSTEGVDPSTGARRKSTNASNRRESSPINTPTSKSRDASRNRSVTPRSREGSPRIPRPRSEEIPMDDFRRSQNSSPVSRNSSNAPSRSHTPSRLALESTNGSSQLTLPINKETNTPVLTATAGPSNTLQPPIELSPESEETSFIDKDKQNKRGVVETV